MAEPERWQVSTDAAEVYESCFVPAIFGAWASPVAGRVDLLCIDELGYMELDRRAAIVDRLTFGGDISETGTQSYRLAQTKARAEAHVG